MLVRNLTQSNLVLKSLNGKKVILPPKKVVNINELDFPKERIKKLFGRYVHILTEKIEEPVDEVPAKVESDLESKESCNTVQPADAATTEEIADEVADSTDNAADVVAEDTNFDTSDLDDLGVNDSAEFKAEDIAEEVADELVVEEPEEAAEEAIEDFGLDDIAEFKVEDTAEDTTEKVTKKKGRKSKKQD